MASRLAGLERIPAIVKKIDTSRAKLEIALIENIQRTNLNALESAKAYARLQDEFDLTQREIAIKIGKSRESIANTMRLLQLPSNIQEALSKGKINESQARTLLSIQDPHKQQITFEKIMGQKTTVRELREKATEHIQTNPEHGFWEKRIEEKLGAPVKIDEHLGRGKISIHFYSKEEKDSILGKLAPEDEF
jgi:ParB family chromosome partitioning protein